MCVFSQDNSHNSRDLYIVCFSAPKFESTLKTINVSGENLCHDEDKRFKRVSVPDGK